MATNWSTLAFPKTRTTTLSRANEVCKRFESFGIPAKIVHWGNGEYVVKVPTERFADADKVYYCNTIDPAHRCGLHHG